MQHKQQGSVLIICLLFMMLITMLALNSARTASFEQRMAHGARDLHTAFQATESALGGGAQRGGEKKKACFVHVEKTN